MNEFTKDTLLKCLDYSIEDFYRELEIYITNDTEDNNTNLILKHGNVIFWIGACIYKLDETKVLYSDEEKHFVDAFRAATNALKHNCNIITLALKAVTSSPVAGCYRAGGHDPMSLLIRSYKKVLIWSVMSKSTVHKEENIADYNELLASKDVHEGIDRITKIIKNHLI